MSVYKYGKRWRAQPEYRGERGKSEVFDLKADAVAYRDAIMSELRFRHKSGAVGQHTLLQAIERYIKEIAPQHKGFRWEVIRLAAFEKSFPVERKLSHITPDDLKQWMNHRKTEVSNGAVLREINLISGIFTAAVKDWGWIAENPWAKIRKPPQPAHRKRIITGSEIRQMLRGLGYVSGQAPRTASQQIAYVFLIALRTGMRDSEITGLEWVDVRDSWVKLHDTKNGKTRDVPMDKVCRRYFAILRACEQRPFTLNPSTRDTRFRQIRNRLELEGFTFHDSRHTAATRIGSTVGQPGRLSFPEFCLVFGWTDPRYALVYVNPSAASLALKM